MTIDMVKKISLLTIVFYTLLTGVNAQTVSPLDQSTFDLRGTVLTDTVTVPLKLDKAALADVDLVSDTPFTVKSGNKNNQRFKNAIRIYLDRQQPVIRLVVDMKMLNMQGTYEVSIGYTIKKDTPALLKVSLVRPAATVDTVSTVYIKIAGGKVITYGPFVLNAEKSLSDINVLQLSNPYFTSINRGDLVSFPAASYTVKAGKYFKAEYSFDNKLISGLDLGKTTGKMLVTSPEMTAPITVNFEIFKRVNKFWIIVAVFAGLLTGALVRHYLKDKKEWEQLRIKGFDLVNQIIAETKGIGDKTVQKKINDLVNGLNVMLSSKGGMSRFTGREDAPLTKKIDETVIAYNSIKDKFKESLKDQEDALKELSAGFENENISITLKTILAAEFNAYLLARKHVGEMNPTDAKTEIDKAINEVNKWLAGFLTYHESLVSVMSTDANNNFYPKAIPDAVKESIKKYLDKIQEQVNDGKEQAKKINDYVAGPKTDAAGAEAARKAVTTAMTKADIILEAEDKMKKYIDENLETIFKYGSGVKAIPEVSSLLTIVDEWKSTLDNIIRNPKGTENAAEYIPPTLMARLDAAWEAAKLKIGGLTLGDNDSAASRNELTEVSLKTRTGFLPPDYFTDRGAAMATLLADTRSAQKNWLLYAFLRTALLALLLGLAALKFYGPSFIGTWDEIIAIFLFAFSVDVTVDNVTQLRDK